MSLDVFLQVSFRANTNDGIAAIAKKHLHTIDVEQQPEVYYYLLELSNRTGENPGRAGGVSQWAVLWPYTNGAEFVNVLRPFWLELLAKEGPHGVGPYNHVMVFAEREQDGYADAYQIGLANPEWGDEEPPTKPELVVKYHRCPFSWMSTD